MWSCMPLILLFFEMETGRSGLGRPALGASQMGETIRTPWCLLIVFFLYAHCFYWKRLFWFFAFLYVMSCPVAPLQVFPYPWFIILCLYSFFSVIHGWVCWVSWSCQFVILIWNSFTIIGSSRCPVCFFFGGLPFHTCGLKCPQLMHVLTCCLEWHTAHACPS